MTEKDISMVEKDVFMVEKDVSMAEKGQNFNSFVSGTSMITLDKLTDKLIGVVIPNFDKALARLLCHTSIATQSMRFEIVPDTYVMVSQSH